MTAPSLFDTLSGEDRRACSISIWSTGRLLAKLLANGRDCRRATVDASGHGGGAEPNTLSALECHGMEEVRGSNPLSSTVEWRVRGHFGNRTLLMIKHSV